MSAAQAGCGRSGSAAGRQQVEGVGGVGVQAV